MTSASNVDSFFFGNGHPIPHWLIWRLYIEGVWFTCFPLFCTLLNDYTLYFVVMNQRVKFIHDSILAWAVKYGRVTENVLHKKKEVWAVWLTSQITLNSAYYLYTFKLRCLLAFLYLHTKLPLWIQNKHVSQKIWFTLPVI